MCICTHWAHRLWSLLTMEVVVQWQPRSGECHKLKVHFSMERAAPSPFTIHKSVYSCNQTATAVTCAGMGTNAAAMWDKVAKLLQDCSNMQPDSADADAVLDSVHRLMRKLEQLPTPPKAVWKKLVQQLKVSQLSCLN